jgi:DinB superfamily
MSDQPEVWLRGPVAGVDPLLMPAAHALMQVLEDAERQTGHLSIEDLWRPAGDAAPIGFHLRHIAGSTDRLLTYARGERLTETQRTVLAAEKSPGNPPANATALLDALRKTIDDALAQLRGTPASMLKEPRPVGRAGMPSTVLGLLFHAAEHAQRHSGQIATTVRALKPTKVAAD